MAILIAAPLARWHTAGLESAASGANTRGKAVEAKSTELLPDEVAVESATAPAKATVVKTPPHDSTPTSEVVAPLKRPVTRPGGGW
ncbi:MAG: hypothetical protein ACREQ7_13215 [Candidatus Binatia bacterium]